MTQLELGGDSFTARPPHRFDGPEFKPPYDLDRLTGQLKRIVAFMRAGEWHTLSEIAAVTGDHEGSISAQLRNLRKERFGSHTVERRPRGDRSHGLFEYRLILNPDSGQ